jgi:hypothetical protein
MICEQLICERSVACLELSHLAALPYLDHTYTSLRRELTALVLGLTTLLLILIMFI